MLVFAHRSREAATKSFDRRFSAKLTPYDGVAEPHETFLARFENFASHFRWDEEERIFNLRSCLVKAIGNVLWDSGNPSRELIALMRSHYDNDNQADRLHSCYGNDNQADRFRSRYGGDNQAHRFHMELRTRHRGKGEPLQTVFQDIKPLMALAFPDRLDLWLLMPSSMRSVIVHWQTSIAEKPAYSL